MLGFVVTLNDALQDIDVPYFDDVGSEQSWPLEFYEIAPPLYIYHCHQHRNVSHHDVLVVPEKVPIWILNQDQYKPAEAIDSQKYSELLQPFEPQFY